VKESFTVRSSSITREAWMREEEKHTRMQIDGEGEESDPVSRRAKLGKLYEGTFLHHLPKVVVVVVVVVVVEKVLM
ncbi:hypothetical protein HID58_030263, partial [Brassica napus]